MAELKKVYSFVGNSESPIEVLGRLKKERGLTDAEIDRQGITLVPPSESKAEVGYPEAGTLIKIPYWGITGEKLADNRGGQLARYRRTVLNSKGERYTQRAGTGCRHFLAKGIDWVNISKDPGIDLFYTEGEFKSLAGCKNLGPTVGNAGVDAWRGGPGKLAEPLDDFVLKGRTVYIVYDAESSSTASVPLKSNVVRALGVLAGELIARGCIVRSLLIARTPTFVEGTKLGLDDYFLAGGTREALMATAVEPEIDEEFARCFQTYAMFVGTKPHVKDIVDGHIYSVRDFELFCVKQTRSINGKQVKLATIYREHPEVNEFREYVFDPQLPSGYLKHEQKFNLWQGFGVGPAHSPNYDQHIQVYQRFVSGVWGEAHAGYFLDWCAHLFQRPWELTTISPILVSRVKGVGKSLSGAVLRSLIGTRSSFLGSVEGLTEKFTGELEGKLFVQVDEADALFDGKESRLKSLDSDEIRIRKMGTDGYTVRNIMRKFYTTNENAAFRIAADERRYFVVRVDKTADDGLEGSEWSQFLRGEIVPLLRDEEFKSNLMEYFITRDIAQWDPGAPVPRTEAMMDMVEAGMTKKDTAAGAIYEALMSSDKIWVTNGAIHSVDTKLWGEVSAIHKDNGGTTCQHTAKIDGRVLAFKVWMPRGKELERHMHAKNGTWLLAGGQLSGQEVTSLLLTTKNLTDPIVQRIVGSKF